MQQHEQSSPSPESSVYQHGLHELHVVSKDETRHRQIEREFAEARGREGARLHVTLSAVSEADRRNLDAIRALADDLRQRADHLTHIVESFETTAMRRFDGVHDDLRLRAESLNSQVESLAKTETQHHQAVTGQVSEFRQVVTEQGRTQFDQLSMQARENTERMTADVRQVRDELVGLVDQRMNQADASFASLRGDIEVVKFLVMDLIKDRIGRTDPRQKAL